MAKYVKITGMANIFSKLFDSNEREIQKLQPIVNEINGLEQKVKKLKDSGVKTIVYSSRKTISWELKLESSKIVYFEDIKDKILRQ